MFTTTLSEIVTVKSLKQAYAQVSKSSVGLDRVSVELFEEDLNASLQEIVDEIHNRRYVPEPLSRIYVPKEHGTQLRPLGIGSLKDKIVQKAIAVELSLHFDKNFSDKSYGYRPNKSTLKAIARVKDYISKGAVYVYRLDIENFFESIPHAKLLDLLATHIADASLRQMIAMFLKNGSFQRYRYIEHFEGIHQGDPLSPLLANLYLNQLDWFWENNGIGFVRFADDSVLFAHEQKHLAHIVTITTQYLRTLSLLPNPQKSHIYHAIKEGFDFLGVHFKGWQTSIAKPKLESIIAKQNEIIKSIHPFSDMTEKLNDHLTGLNRYYYKIIEEGSAQFVLLQDALLLALSKRITKERKQGTITTKKAFREMLESLAFPSMLTSAQKKDYIERIINKGLDGYLATKKYKQANSKIAKKKKEYAKKYATASVLYVSDVGTFLGVAKNTIVLKQRGRVIFKMPKNQCERIIIASTSVSISGALVKLCATMGIAIDFIDMYAKSTPYASLYGAKNAYAKMTLKQLKVLDTPLHLKLAKAFIKGKVKNQINYLKYLNKYHKLIDEPIKAMEKQLVRMLSVASTPNELMGHEGMSALSYWHGLAAIVDDKIDFKGRITYGATDLVNSALNYGYAILYSRVQYHAVRAGLSLHVSFLHALDESKPTLVYDLIEEFRAFVVDRTIFTMINQREPIKLDSEYRLDTKSRQLIAKKVLERIGSYTRHKRASKKIDTIIAEQAYMLVRAIKGLTRYKPFIGKY
jgi:group II intron reverse transcriptase/maturase/CRISPR-associated endonuclease Cas1